MTQEFPSLMSSKIRRQTFQPSCPAGGKFYACDYGQRFMGCCVSEPCDYGCDGSSLKPTSFLEEKYIDIPESSCPPGSDWYTCAKTTPTFLGCCRSDPCQQNGCPAEDLAPATLSSEPSHASPYSPIPNPSLAQLTKTSRVASTSLSNLTNIRSRLAPLSSLGLPTTTSTPLPSASTSPSSKMRIIGGTIGGVFSGAIAVIVIGILFFLYRRRKVSKRPSLAPVHSDPPSATEDTLLPIYPMKGKADSRLLVPHIDSSPMVQIDGSPLSQIDGSPLSQLDGSPISELAPSPPPPRPVFEFPA